VKGHGAEMEVIGSLFKRDVLACRASTQNLGGMIAWKRSVRMMNVRMIVEGNMNNKNEHEFCGWMQDHVATVRLPNSYSLLQCIC
jgi:hypothetical protein